MQYIEASILELYKIYAFHLKEAQRLSILNYTKTIIFSFSTTIPSKKSVLVVDVYVMVTLSFALHRLKILIFCNVNVNITLLDSIATNALKDMYRNGMWAYPGIEYIKYILTNVAKIDLYSS